MSVASELVARLKSQTPSSQVFEVRRPDGVRAQVIVVSRVSNVPHSDITGVARLHDARYQVSVFASDLTAGRDMRDAVIAALHGYQGGLIKNIAHESDTEIFEDRDTEYHFPIDFIVTH